MTETLVRPDLCSRGHDRNVVGKVYSRTNTAGYCRQCKRELDRKYAAERANRAPKKEKCDHGHVFAEVGTTWGGRCRECQRLACLRYYYRVKRKKKMKNPNCLLAGKRVPHLRAIREKLGYSRPQMAHLTGISHHTIASIERRNGRARPHVLEKLVPFIADELQKEKVERYG